MSMEPEALSLEQLIQASWQRLRARAISLTGCLQDADDLLQEAMVRACKAWPTFRGDASFNTWVNRIMTNIHRDQCRRRRRIRFISLDRPSRELQRVQDALATWAGELEHRLELQERRLALEKALQQLSKRDRKVLVLKYLRQLSYEELAQKMGCSVESVRSRLYRARQTVRRRLSRERN